MQEIIIKAASAITAISPLLAAYLVVPGITLSSFLVCLITILFLFSHQKDISFNHEIFLFAGIIFLSTTSSLYHLIVPNNWYDFQLLVHNLFSISMCFFPLCILIRHLNTKIFIHISYISGTIASAIVIWQQYTLLTTGSFYKDFFLPFFELNRDVDSLGIRPSAFFTEPAHFSIFILPIFFTAIIHKKIFLTLFLGFGILCSGSTTGFLLIAILVFYHFIQASKKNFIQIIISIVITSATYFAIQHYASDILLNNYAKLESAEKGDSDIRLLGPLTYASYLNFFEKIFGITLNQLSSFLQEFGIYRIKNYANAFIFMFFSYGLFGELLLISYLLKKWFEAKKTKGYFIIFIGILASDQIIFNTNFLYLSIYLILSDKIFKECEKNEVVISNNPIIS